MTSSSASTYDYEGSLYVEVFKVYEEMFCCVVGKKFQAYRKARAHLPASSTNKAELALQFEVFSNECDCKTIKYGLSDLSKVMKASKLAETPYFFNVIMQDKVYQLAAATEEDRIGWMRCFRHLAKVRERKPDAWIATGFLEGNYPSEGTNRFGPTTSPMMKMTSKIEKPPPDDPLLAKKSSATKIKRKADKDDDTLRGAAAQHVREEEEARPSEDTHIEFEEETAGEEDNSCIQCIRNQETFLGLKVDTIVRLLKVCLAFPFVIVVSSLNLSNKYTFLRSMTGMRIMNVLVYVAPVVYVKFLLSQYNDTSVQRIAIGFYILLYLFPVGYVVFSKVTVSSSTSKIEEGTFCFKPARAVHFTQANFYALFGFVMEWMQHVLYVLPLGIVTSDKAAKLSDFPPYLSFDVYFWISVISTFLCGLIVILNAVLKGKLHYRFQNSYAVWFFLYNVGSPMFVTIVTILFMSLWCDYTTDPPSLVQQPSIVCYGDQHIAMARAALTAFAVYIIQHTLLPSGTFKETMRDSDLEIMFVPVYLQAHYLLKAIFCGFYVYFYNDNFVRVIVLTIINMMLLALNNFMKPCSVSWVNLLRDCFFVHATLSGIISLNYLAWPVDSSTKGMVISTLASTVVFSTIGTILYYKYTARSTEYTIASAFLDLEWQVSRGGSVHPRVLEPLISLTLSNQEEDWEIAKKYIGQLVWLISYPNMRVQFQSAWGLANLALVQEDARMKIHEAGGTKTLFEWYMEMDFVVQLETLAALANLTLSMEVSEDMVLRHKCIPFFIGLVSSNKMKHSQFSAIALANLARKEAFRDLIRKHGGIPALVSCIMSHDYQKRRHGSRALANMALSPSKEIEQVFESKGLIDRIIKMAVRKEIETQREVVALIRNLACHARLRPLLLDRGVMSAVEASKVSVFPEVRQWCLEITQLLEREITSGAIDLKALMRREGAKGNSVGETDVELLKRMEPLQGRVEWSTWGSKLETIFEPVFSTIPSLLSSNVTTAQDMPVSIMLPVGVTKHDLQRFRDSLSYAVAERPSHGKLSEYNTVYDHVTYTPNPGYVGTDFFTYRMMIGSSLTAPATIAINVVDAESLDSTETGQTFAKGGGKIQTNSHPHDIEQGPEGTTGRNKGKKRESIEVEMANLDDADKSPKRAPKSKDKNDPTPFLRTLMSKTSSCIPKNENDEEDDGDA